MTHTQVLIVTRASGGTFGYTGKRLGIPQTAPESLGSSLGSVHDSDFPVVCIAPPGAASDGSCARVLATQREIQMKFFVSHVGLALFLATAAICLVTGEL